MSSLDPLARVVVDEMIELTFRNTKYTKYSGMAKCGYDPGTETYTVVYSPGLRVDEIGDLLRYREVGADPEDYIKIHVEDGPHIGEVVVVDLHRCRNGFRIREDIFYEALCKMTQKQHSLLDLVEWGAVLGVSAVLAVRLYFELNLVY